MKWIIWIVLFVLLCGCIKRPILSGERVIDTTAADCICEMPPNEDVADYVLIGKERVARWQETLGQCRVMMEDLVDK